MLWVILAKRDPTHVCLADFWVHRKEKISASEFFRLIAIVVDPIQQFEERLNLISGKLHLHIKDIARVVIDICVNTVTIPKL